MGFFIETPGHTFNKAQVLCREHDATLVKMSSGEVKAWEPLEKIVNDPKHVLICVVQNEAFDAAMIVYDDRELDRIRRSVENGDRRPLSWLVMDPLVVKRLNVHVPMVD